MGVRVKWYGREYTNRLYNNLDNRLYKVARRVEDKAKKYVPVDTGELKNSIHTSKVKRMHYRVGSSLSYAKIVELGSSRSSAKPYLRPSLYSTKGI